MIVVRNTFIAKPGSASKLAAQLKDAAGTAKDLKYRILTDMTGQFNTVVMEFEANNTAEFEARMAEYQAEGAFRDKMKGYTDLYVSGSREIFKII